MLNVDKLIQSALECLGWPYESPGTNDKNGIDCSGLWVKCFKDQGEKIYHGSNTIFREYCTETGKLLDEVQLEPGMAVFKCKNWTDSEDDKSNRWYGKDPGNLYHIGMVTGVNPLVITHATTPCVKQDFKIGNWTYWGKVKKVDYDNPEPGPGPEPPTPPTPVTETATVVCASGNSVKMRSKPTTRCNLYWDVPKGATVVVKEKNIENAGETWSKIVYAGITGYMMQKFLQFNDDPPVVTLWTVHIPHLTEEVAQGLIAEYPGAYMTSE